MIQNVTIREQMTGAFRRAGYFVQGEPITLRQHILLEAYTELCREFDASAIALTPAADFDEIAHKMGYQKSDPDKVRVKRGLLEACKTITKGYITLVRIDETNPKTENAEWLLQLLTAALEGQNEH